MIVAYTERLTEHLEGRLDERSRSWAGYVVEGAVRMQSLIEGLLEFSRVRQDETEFSDIDCELVLRRALANLDAAVAESGASITHDPLPTISADATQLLQLFQNLIANAIKFRAEAPPAVQLSCGRENGHWHFSVSDNGIGVDPRDAERILGLFQRLHSKDDYPGAGIGLALCRKFTEAHGGRIWVAQGSGSAPGATFRIALPVTPHSEP